MLVVQLINVFIAGFSYYDNASAAIIGANLVNNNSFSISDLANLYISIKETVLSTFHFPIFYSLLGSFDPIFSTIIEILNLPLILSVSFNPLSAFLDSVMPFVYIILETLGLIVPLLIAVAYTTLLERKVMAGIQRRRGPNVVGLYGLLQPLADGVKLFLKETIIPNNANVLIFVFSPVLTFFLSLVTWCVVPFENSSAIVDLNVGMLYLLAISSLSVYGIIMAGWSSNSKYAFLGALRSAAQLISYEISISVIILTVLVCVGSLNLSDIVLAQEVVWFIFPLFPSFVMFMISGLAETNRAPFDLPEAEAELVSGYNVEYSSMTFALFFLGEYAHMILMGSMSSILFLGGWLPPLAIVPFIWVPGYIWFGLKVTAILFFFVWVRAAFPRYRYDQLMRIGWKVFLPLSFGWFLFVSGVIYCFYIIA
jgi:NADH-quinone oxidoreductase subunit H